MPLDLPFDFASAVISQVHIRRFNPQFARTPNQPS